MRVFVLILFALVCSKRILKGFMKILCSTVPLIEGVPVGWGRFPRSRRTLELLKLSQKKSLYKGLQ